MLADLQPGDVVLDLGSGGGIDVLLSGRRVGPNGKAYGLDMTPEMLDLARKNQADAGATNVEFLQGTIENIPLPDATVDVVISNCVVNLSPGQGRRASGGLPGPQAGRKAGDLRHRAAPTPIRVDTGTHRAVDRLCRRCAGQRRLRGATTAQPGFEIVSITPTRRSTRTRTSPPWPPSSRWTSRFPTTSISRADHAGAGRLDYECIRPRPKGWIVPTSGPQDGRGGSRHVSMWVHSVDLPIRYLDGARFTVTRRVGHGRWHDNSAARTRSRDSGTAASGSPTTVKPGRPDDTWTSTDTERPSTPYRVADGIRASMTSSDGRGTAGALRQGAGHDMRTGHARCFSENRGWLYQAVVPSAQWLRPHLTRRAATSQSVRNDWSHISQPRWNSVDGVDRLLNTFSATDSGGSVDRCPRQSSTCLPPSMSA